MRKLCTLIFLAAGACAAPTASQTAVSDVPPVPGPGPMRAEADAATAAIEVAAKACAAGRVAEVTRRFEDYAKVSRPMAPDLGEPELGPQLRRLCSGGAGSVAEVNTMVEDMAIQPGWALATVTLHGRLRAAPPNDHFTVRGIVQLQHDSDGWRIARAAYWPHAIPPVS